MGVGVKVARLVCFALGGWQIRFFFLFGLFEERGGLQGGPKLMAHTFEEPLRKTSIWGY